MLQEADGPLTSAEIARRLGVHKNTARFHLESLSAAGQVSQAALAAVGPGRPAQVFSVVRGMDPNGPRHYRMLAEVLTEALQAAPDGRERAIDAGRAWGRAAAASSAGPLGSVAESITRLVELLDRFGFAPEGDGGAPVSQAACAAEEVEPDEAGKPGSRRTLPVIGVRHCPFLELAENHRQIVCPVHLGLMRGALEAWGAPVCADTLEPFVEPDLCLVHLSAGTYQAGE